MGHNWPTRASERERPLRSPNDQDAEGPLLDTQIEQVYKNGMKTVMRVHFGGGMVRATPNHPWYVKGGKWVASALLKPGDLLRTDEGTWIPVDRTEDLGEVAEVYNLRVAGTHTYFIGNGNGQFVLVHNLSISGAWNSVKSAVGTVVQGAKNGVMKAAAKAAGRGGGLRRLGRGRRAVVAAALSQGRLGLFRKRRQHDAG